MAQSELKALPYLHPLSPAALSRSLCLCSHLATRSAQLDAPHLV